ncbi:glycosyltransferase family 4 protein [Edaphocola aurantiacus]|uniref:glycosyltransferase family 4 protein n=1 Tax=Edaphocola aurantiacus TaxID=2601682 RepID=UPI001C962D1E|nr:glycosyltransferase family 4 protein [Edaphocola aurantiacus]
MSILVLTNRIPYPLNDGGNLAVNNMLEGLLLQGAEVSLLSMNTTRHRVAEQQFPALFNQLKQVITVNVDNRIKPVAALTHLLRGKSYNIARFINAAFAAALTRILQEQTFDVVLLEGLFVTPYVPLIRKHSKATICYRQHNVEFEIWERLARTTGNPAKRWYLHQLATALKKYELKHKNDYDLIAAISPVDAAHYHQAGCTIPIVTVPFALPAAQINKDEVNNIALSLYHIGAMDWQPNQEGILWFLEQVWPIVLQQVPQAHLHLAGRNMPESFTTGHWPGVTVAGEVADARAFEQDKNILIVPIHSGGGIRVKILQSMARGKAVITTAVGLQGIEAATDGKEVLVADTAPAFATHCISLLNNINMVTEMGEQAFQLIRRHYELEQVSAYFVHTLRQHKLSDTR